MQIYTENSIGGIEHQELQNKIQKARACIFHRQHETEINIKVTPICKNIKRQLSHTIPSSRYSKFAHEA